MNNILITLTVLLLSCNSELDKEKSILVSSVGEAVENRKNETDVENIVYNSSEGLRTELYKGTLNESTVIWLYLKEQEHPCGGNLTIIDAMYRYDNQEKWILLDVTEDRSKKNYCMVEDNFTGVLFLEVNKNSFIGKWVSPDTKKQLKVELYKEALSKDRNEQLEETLFDDLLYKKNDC